MTELPTELDFHRSALLLWAKCQMPEWLRGKLDPADLVQQTLLEAHAAREALDGCTSLEMLCYLRRALSHNLIDATRKHARSRNNVSPDACAQSSARLANWLAAEHTSPSERADRNERFEKLASALAELPEAQRIAVEMRYLQQMKVAEIARLMDRNENAVSQLLHRAVVALRGALSAIA